MDEPRYCHPEFGCNCVEVAVLEVKKGQVLVVTGATDDGQAGRIKHAFDEAFARAGKGSIPVLVGPALTLTVVDAE